MDRNNIDCTTSCTISFRDPRVTAEEEFELHHRTNLPKSDSKCQGNWSRPIKVEEVLVVRSYGRITWTDKSTGKEKAKFDPMYKHFHENCLKNFSEAFYAPGQSFDFSQKKKKKWPKDTRKAYGSRQNIAVVIGNKVKFQKTIIYSLGILSNFLWKWSRWSSIFSEFRLMAAFFTTSHVPVCRVVLKFVDSYR